MNNVDERWRKANIEYENLKQWAIAETQKVWADLDKKGVVHGLDTNREAYVYIHEEYRRRLEEIFDKYDLPRPKK